jgi:hypothetical protein
VERLSILANRFLRPPISEGGTSTQVQSLVLYYRTSTIVVSTAVLLARLPGYQVQLYSRAILIYLSTTTSSSREILVQYRVLNLDLVLLQ